MRFSLLYLVLRTEVCRLHSAIQQWVLNVRQTGVVAGMDRIESSVREGGIVSTQ
jgi:hypothetical protein